MHQPCCFNEQRAPLQTASLRKRSALAGGGRCPLVRGWVVRSAASRPQRPGSYNAKHKINRLPGWSSASLAASHSISAAKFAS
jgi:hypothetical protein